MSAIIFWLIVFIFFVYLGKRVQSSIFEIDQLVLKMRCLLQLEVSSHGFLFCGPADNFGSMLYCDLSDFDQILHHDHLLFFV